MKCERKCFLCGEEMVVNESKSLYKWKCPHSDFDVYWIMDGEFSTYVEALHRWMPIPEGCLIIGDEVEL
jgi:hypothetical protein